MAGKRGKSTGFRKSLAMAVLLGSLSVASAQTLDMQGMAPADDDARPTRGMTQANVESRFGVPDSKQPAVGEPPISRWDYKEFVVFFEYDRVIHAVVRR